MKSLVAACVLALAPVSSAFAHDWLVISGAAYHFERRDELLGNNPGIGWERPDDEIPVVYAAGYYKNSYDKDTFYAGGQWMPFSWGTPEGFNAQLGAFGGLASGYWTPVVVIPMLKLAYQRVGINIVALPTVGDYAGYVAAQLRFRFN